jgi:hypothetical protein
MATKKENVQSDNLDQDDENLSSLEVLKQIGKFVLKETDDKGQLLKKTKKTVFLLNEELKIKKGKVFKGKTIPIELATLKSIIRKIVNDELEKKSNLS